MSRDRLGVEHLAAGAFGEERAAARAGLRVSSPRRACSRHRARSAGVRDDAAARSAADAEHDGRAEPLGRPRPSLHAAGPLGARPGVAEPSAVRARQPARAGHVGRRGPDAPLSDEGAHRAGRHVPAVLRALHADGSRRSEHAAGREVPVCRSRAGAAQGDARLRALDAGDPGRARVGRGHRERSHRPARGVRLGAARHPARPRPSARLQEPRGAPAALPPRRRPGGAGAAGGEGEIARRQPRPAHAREPRAPDHAARRSRCEGPPRPRIPRRPQPGRPPARCQRDERRPARPVPRVARPGLDHAVLRVPVRHGPERRALANDAVGSAGDPVGDHGLPSRLCDSAPRLRRAAPRQDVGSPGRGVRSRARHQPLARERLGGRRRRRRLRRVLRPDSLAARGRSGLVARDSDAAGR